MFRVCITLIFLLLSDRHIRLQKRCHTLYCLLQPCIANFLKLVHAANQTHNCSSMSSLTFCFVISLATLRIPSSFSRFLQHAGGGAVLRLFFVPGCRPQPPHNVKSCRSQELQKSRASGVKSFRGQELPVSRPSWVRTSWVKRFWVKSFLGQEFPGSRASWVKTFLGQEVPIVNGFVGQDIPGSRASCI